MGQADFTLVKYYYLLYYPHVKKRSMAKFLRHGKM